MIRTFKRGFTLIEVSIVLVIIGLLVSGVLTGRDLINAAKIRQQIGQYEKMNAAINTFRGKYNGLPGDLPNAANYGFVARAGSLGHGDGNRIIDTCNPGSGIGADINPIGCERVLFWADLGEAGLIDQKFPLTTDTLPAMTSYEDSQLYLPTMKLDPNYTLIVAQDASFYGWYRTIHIVHMNDPPPLSGFDGGQLKVYDVYNIDKKMDNGDPLSGTVQIKGEGGSPFTYFGAPSQGAGFCVNANAYDLIEPNAIFCALAVKMNY